MRHAPTRIIPAIFLVGALAAPGARAQPLPMRDPLRPMPAAGQNTGGNNAPMTDEQRTAAVADARVGRAIAPLAEGPAFAPVAGHSTAMNGLRSGLSYVPAAQREAAASEAVSAMSIPEVRDAVLAVPAEQRGALLLALAGLPLAQRGAAADLVRTNPTVASAVLKPGLTTADRVSILTVLPDVPPIRQGDFASMLSRQPAAAQSLAAIPNPSSRERASLIVVMTGRFNGDANLVQVAAAAAEPRVQQFVDAMQLSTVEPRHQAQFVSLLANPQIRNTVLARDAAGADRSFFTQISMLNVMSGVMAAPVPAGSSRSEMVSSALRAVADPAVLAVLAPMMVGASGRGALPFNELRRSQIVCSAAVILGNTSNGSALRAAFGSLSGSVNSRTLVAEKMATLSPLAVLPFLQGADRVSRNDATDGIVLALPSDRRGDATLLLGSNNPGIQALRAALVALPGTVEMKADILVGLMDSREGQTLISSLSRAEGVPVTSLPALTQKVQAAQRVLSVEALESVVFFMPPADRFAATQTLGANTPAGAATRDAVASLPGGPVVRAFTVSALLSNNALTPAALERVRPILLNPSVAALSAEEQGGVAAVLSVSPPATLAAFRRLPMAAGQEEAVTLLTAVRMPTNPAQGQLLTNALTLLASGDVRNALGRLPEADRVPALLILAAQPNQAPAAAAQSVPRLAGLRPIQTTLTFPAYADIRRMVR